MPSSLSGHAGQKGQVVPEDESGPKAEVVVVEEPVQGGQIRRIQKGQEEVVP